MKGIIVMSSSAGHNNNTKAATSDLEGAVQAKRLETRMQGLSRFGLTVLLLNHHLQMPTSRYFVVCAYVVVV